MTDRFVTVPDSLELPAAVKVGVDRLHDSTVAGRALLTGADAAAQRSSLGLGWVDAATGMDLLTRTALRTGQSVQPPTLQRVTSTPTGTGPRFIEKVGDLLYGAVGATGAIHTSPDGYTWTQVNATWPGASGFISRLVPTSDGEMIAQTIENLGMSTVRGSTKRGGVAAMRELLDVVAQNGIAVFTPDGPRGTCGESCCTTEVRAARSKMGAASAGVMNPERSLVLVGAVTDMVSSCGRIYGVRRSADAERRFEVLLQLGAVQAWYLLTTACALAEVRR